MGKSSNPHQRGRGRGHGRGRGRGRGGNRGRGGLGNSHLDSKTSRRRGASMPFDLASIFGGKDTAAFFEMDQEMDKPKQLPSSKHRGSRRSVASRGGKRGANRAVTSHNHVPFNYSAPQSKPPLPEEANATLFASYEQDDVKLKTNPERKKSERVSTKVKSVPEHDDDHNDEEREEDEEDEEEDDDIVIEPHKRNKGSILHRRKLEGLVVNDLQQIVQKREYNVRAMMKHANPLLRPILFVRASGIYDKTSSFEPNNFDSVISNENMKTQAGSSTSEGSKTQSKAQSLASQNERRTQNPQAPRDNIRDEKEEILSKQEPIHMDKHTSHDDEEFLSFKLADQILESSSDRKPVSEQDEILADWMENAMLSGPELVPIPAMAGISDPFGEHTTLEDIAIDAHERERDAWQSDSDDENENEEDDDEDEDVENLEDEMEQYLEHGLDDSMADNKLEENMDGVEEAEEFEDDDASEEIFEEELHALLLSGLGKDNRWNSKQSDEDENFLQVLRGSFPDEDMGFSSTIGQVPKKSTFALMY